MDWYRRAPVASRVRCWWTKGISTRSMRNFDRRLRAVFVALVSLAGASVPAAAQSPAAERYAALLEQDTRVSGSPASTADDFRLVVNRYWSFVRRYPTSGYADNALWQAAG